jgi:hypothetical protein
VLLPLSLLVSLLLGCSPKRPPRYVIESDLPGFHYGRYQKVLDIELPMPENPAVGHTATYLRGAEPVQIVPVFVTAYSNSTGLGESVRARLKAMTSYALDVQHVAGEHVWHLRGESGDVWLLWVSGAQLVKIGAPQGEPRVPSGVAEAYLDVYPSDLDRKGKTKGPAASLALSDGMRVDAGPIGP